MKGRAGAGGDQVVGDESRLEVTDFRVFFFFSQVVDAFCTSRANLSGPKAVESVLAWTLRFCSLGGVGHLVSALKV